jgi:thymidylate kinase
MDIVLITGPGGSGKSLIMNALKQEYKARRYDAIFIDNVEKKELDGAVSKAMLDKGGHLPPEFCVISSLELTQADFHKPLYRVIRTGRT